MSERVDDMLEQMDAILDDCRQRNCRLGFFAALYRKVTQRVKEDIEQGAFEDNERMEKLDILFAKRYLDAYAQYHRGEKPTQSWLYAFERADDNHLLILQHLLLGMNAHINLDLGIAAARTSPGDELPSLEQDFIHINEILASLLDSVQEGIGQVSPALRLLDEVFGVTDEALCNFSMRHARRAAWGAAQRLAPVSLPQQVGLVDQLDREAYRIARLVASPLHALNPILITIARAEHDDVGEVIDVLL